MLSHIHHLTFVVRNLENAVQQYESSFGVGPFIREPLASRGVTTARVMIGDVWLVFVQPTDPDGEPGRHLARFGEGLLLMSFGVDDLGGSIAALRGTPMAAKANTRREGLGSWEVVDLETSTGADYSLQLTQT